MHRTVVATCAVILAAIVKASENFDEDVRVGLHTENRSLSRKRRYLLFPVGSSLQLVYDTTFPLIIASSPFVFGSTAAVAWELPYELIGPLFKLKEKLRRVDKPGWQLESSQKKNKKVFAGAATKFRPQYDYFLPEYTHYYKPVRYGNTWHQNSGPYRQTQNRKYTYHRRVDYGNRNGLYASEVPITTYVEPVYNEAHRRTRRQLFAKVEKFLVAQRRDGRACLLKAVCEVSQAPDVGEGTFVEEIVKAIFRSHPHHSGKENDVYDLAATKQSNCTDLYPTCDFSLWSII